MPCALRRARRGAELTVSAALDAADDTVSEALDAIDETRSAVTEAAELAVSPTMESASSALPMILSLTFVRVSRARSTLRATARLNQFLGQRVDIG
ncbi:MAG TPA: hypothetical protein VJ757_10080 [Pseudonocardiaceae bacterium]|nr:hypothetical protein [Pseudonocardiaceae bacterium]